MPQYYPHLEFLNLFSKLSGTFLKYFHPEENHLDFRGTCCMSKFLFWPGNNEYYKEAKNMEILESARNILQTLFVGYQQQISKL